MYGDKKHKVGSKVEFKDPKTDALRTGTVKRHGRDMQGLYTQVVCDDNGEDLKMHRSYLRKATGAS